MKISYSWLKQFLQLDWEPVKTGELLTDLGLEVEGIEKKESIKGGLEGVVVGEVLTCEQHPNADKLRVTTVDLGLDVPVQIVCGAPNVAKGQKVPVATIGTVLYDSEGKDFKIKKGKIRGEVSFGMICAEDELGLGKSHDGIMVLDSSLNPGTPCAEVFELKTDYVFEIGLTPNRADAMSHLGVARDLKAGLLQQGSNLELITPSVSDYHVDERTLKIDTKIEDTQLTPRYASLTISNITVKDSPKWIQDYLRAIGIVPKNNIVDITNYVLHELGQPLHAYDTGKIIGGKVLVKSLEDKTKFTTLDGVTRELSSEDIMICDAENTPLCIAGVLGGLDSGVTESTTSIFLESAYFNSVAIRKTAKRHGLNTDASFRFERGTDINTVKYALKRAALLIEKYAGGKITSDITDCYPNKVQDHQVVISFENINRVVGEELPKQTIKNILASLEIKVNSVTELGLGLTIPAYRVDVLREADVIEEILRVYGYNNIQFSHKLNSSISYHANRGQKLENTIADMLVSLSFNETMSNSLTKPEYIDLSQTLSEEHNVTMLNPLSNDLKVMRQSLLFGGLESIIYNINRKNNDLKFFEFGKTYHKYEQKYHESKHLTLLVSGNRTPDTWTSPSSQSDFFYTKGVIMAIFERLGLKNLKASPTESDLFSEGLSLSLGKIKLVDFGVVTNKVLKEFSIKQEVIFADIYWDSVIHLCHKNEIKLIEIPKYPSVKRDLALLIDKDVSFKDIYNLALKSERKLLKDVDLFDVYQGDNLPEGKKSYAVSFVIQDLNRTLKEKQIDKIMVKLQETFKTNLGAVLR